MFASSRFKLIECPFSIGCDRPAELCPFSHVGVYFSKNASITKQDMSTNTEAIGRIPAHNDAQLETPLKITKRMTSNDVTSSVERTPKERKLDHIATALSQKPLILPSLTSKIPKEQRQKVLNKFFEEFRRIYKHVLKDSPKLAHEHALRQEQKLHDNAIASTYVSNSVSTLTRLRTRPIAYDINDVGIDGEWKASQKMQPSLDKNAQVIKKLELLLADLETLAIHNYPLKVDVNTPKEYKLLSSRNCNRCGKITDFTDFQSLKDLCRYHDGYLMRDDHENQRIYSCCNEVSGSEGCITGYHVFKVEDNQELGMLIPFKEFHESSQALNALALDCEMAYTTLGMEVIRLTVMDLDENILIDELCNTTGTVIDLNTQFSGVTSLEHAKHDLESIQAFLQTFVSPKTIFIGHGLENDLKVLRIVHERIIDTCAVFKHPKGMPFRFSLKRLCKDLLGKMIQQGSHDSKEDTKACLDLIKYKLKEI